MKKCPYCAEEIQDAAVVCRFCQRDLVAPVTPTVTAPAPASSPPPQAKKPTSPLAWGCLTILIVMAVLAAFCGKIASDISDQRQASSTTASIPPPSTTPPAKPPPATPPRRTPPPMAQHDLALLSSRGYESYGYHIIEGQVKNVSGQAMKNVMVKGTWFDKADGFITSDDSLIDYNPILPGQTSAFKTMSRTNPEMSKYSVEFRTFAGSAITTDDRRKK